MPLIERQPVDCPAPLDDNPLLDRIYRNRGVVSREELDYRLSQLLPPGDMKGMSEAASTIADAIQAQERILVIGDFDCDGATATAVAVRGLKMLGALNVEFLVPDRMKHGYGLTPSIVEVAAEKEPDLIITVDNGISSFEGAKAVKKLLPDAKLVITDHHLPSPDGVPEAAAVINPNQEGCGFASKAIAGCGVMFYALLGVRQQLRAQCQWASREEEPQLQRLLDIVALGTVADLVPLDRNNRILVDAGLKQIAAGLACPGINVLLKQAKRDPLTVTASDMGFTVAPRINAAGRIEDMTLGIRCLLEDELNVAAGLGAELNDINLRRRDLEADMVEEAMAAMPDPNQLAADGAEQDSFCLYRPDWHEGVVGLVASRIKEKLARPVICITDTEETRARRELAGDAEVSDQDEVKGSARSIPGIHLKHTLDKISKDHPGLLTKFGGHAMAAGLTLRKGRLEEFREAFSAAVAAQMTSELRAGAKKVDCLRTPAQWVTLENARAIERAGPWGQGFEAPTFAALADVVSYDLLQDKHLKLRLKLDGGEAEHEAIAFNAAEQIDLIAQGRVAAVFEMDVNRWRGNERLQLRIADFAPAIELEAEKSVAAPHRAPSRKPESVPAPAVAPPAKNTRQGIPMTEPGSTLF